MAAGDPNSARQAYRAAVEQLEHAAGKLERAADALVMAEGQLDLLAEHGIDTDTDAALAALVDRGADAMLRVQRVPDSIEPPNPAGNGYPHVPPPN